jgi:lysophospholipase L1-like esterase
MSVLLALLLALPAAAQIADDGGEVQGKSAYTGPKRIVVFGDSHTTMSYGVKLHSLLNADYKGKYEVELYGASGASPWWFYPYKSKDAEAEAGKKQPHGYAGKSGNLYIGPDGKADKTSRDAPLLGEMLKPGLAVGIISLGTNQIECLGGGKARYIMKKSGDLAEAVRKAGGKCVWLGPPFHSRKPACTDEKMIRGFYEKLKAEIGDCAVVDGLAATLSESFQKKVKDAGLTEEDVLTKNDKMHYQPKAGQFWAEEVYVDLKPLLP